MIRKLNIILFTIVMLIITLVGCDKNSNYMLYKYKDGDKYGFVDSKGNVVVEATYDKVNNFSEGLACVMKNNKEIYFLDLKGNIKITLPEKYDYSSIGFEKASFNEGYCVISTNTKDLLINKNGKILSEKDYFGEISNGLITFKDESGMYGLMDIEGNEMLSATYQYLGEYNDGLISFKDKKTGNYGYINEYGVVIIEPLFKKAKEFINGIAMVTDENYNDGKLFFPINKDGEIVDVSVHYPSILNHNDGTYIVVARYKLGVINEEGETVIKCMYDLETNQSTLARGFSEGLAAVTVDQGVGFINKENKMVIKPQFDNLIEPFKNDIAILSNDDKWVYINKEGKVLFEK